jgi:hypothetical protein
LSELKNQQPELFARLRETIISKIQSYTPGSASNWLLWSYQVRDSMFDLNEMYLASINDTVMLQVVMLSNIDSLSESIGHSAALKTFKAVENAFDRVEGGITDMDIDDIEPLNRVLETNQYEDDDRPLYLQIRYSETRLRIYFYYKLLNSLQDLTDNAKEIITAIFGKTFGLTILQKACLSEGSRMINNDSFLLYLLSLGINVVNVHVIESLLLQQD